MSQSLSPGTNFARFFPFEHLSDPSVQFGVRGIEFLIAVCSKAVLRDRGSHWARIGEFRCHGEFRCQGIPVSGNSGVTGNSGVRAREFRCQGNSGVTGNSGVRAREFRCQGNSGVKEGNSGVKERGIPVSKGEFRCQSIFSRGGRPRRRGSRTMPRRWEMTSTQSSAP
jgi:hypothetical protein